MRTAIGTGEVIAVLGSLGPAVRPAGASRAGTDHCTPLSQALQGEAPASRVLFLDEPFAGLDPTVRVELQEALLRVWEESDVTLVLTTHDLDEALYMADRIIVMTGGPEAPVRTVLDVPFGRPRVRDAVLDDAQYGLFRQRLTDLLDRRGGTAPAGRDDGSASTLRPKPDRRQTHVPMPPPLERRRA